LLFLVLVIASIPVWIGVDSFEAIVSLHPWANSASPFFIAEHGFLLYLWAPLVALSSFVLLLTPGLSLALMTHQPRNVAEWILVGFVASLVLLSLVLGIVQSAQETPLTGLASLKLISISGLAAFAILFFGELKAPRKEWPWERKNAAYTLVLMAVVPMLLLVVLSPKFYWETFNGDGVHAYESARLLLTQAVPFWPGEAGGIAAYPDASSFLFAYPMSWFIRVFGSHEIAARLPYLLFLIPLFGALLALFSLIR